MCYLTTAPGYQWSLPLGGISNQVPWKGLCSLEVEAGVGLKGERKFRIIMKMMQDLRKIMKIQEMFTKDLEELKNKQTRMRNTRKIQ